MPPMADYAWARLVPNGSSTPREIIPMERFNIEFSFGPFRKTIQCLTLRKGRRPLDGLWKLIFEINVRPYAHNEYSTTLLCNVEVLGVKYLPSDSVARESI